MGEVIPLKPKPAGKAFADSANGVLELLQRARLVLAPRDAWRKGGWTGKKMVAGETVCTRCLVQALKDSDGPYVTGAVGAVAKVIRELYPGRGRFHGDEATCTGFNDHRDTIKYDVLRVLDVAIERGA